MDLVARVADRYNEAQKNAQTRSLSSNYKGCGVHVNSVIDKVNGVPMIIGFVLSDWHGPETVATYVNGEERS